MPRSVWTGLALVCVALASCFRPAPRASLAEEAAQRPRPDLLTLAERCAPAREGPDAMEAFHDLLQLREQPDPQAVPALERVLHDHQGSTRIHGFAAAQALHAIGTPQAQQILARHLLSSTYPALQGIQYAFFHGLSPALRDDFIERYHLRNLAEDVSLGLAVTTGADSSVLFTVTATNTSTHALRLLDPGHSLGAKLFLRSEKGAFIPAQGLPRAELEFVHTKTAPQSVELRPGAHHEWRIAFRKRPVRELDSRYPGLARDSELVLDSAGSYFDLGHPGRFQAIAILEGPQVARSLPACGDGACWTGRAVSAPVMLEIQGS